MTFPALPLVAELDHDLAATAARPQLQRDEDELATALALRNSVALNSFRLRAGLPLRPAKKDVELWHAFLNYRYWLAKYGRRHPHHPINRALSAQGFQS